MRSDLIKDILKETPLRIRLKVSNEFAFINLITELGYRENKSWDENDEEDNRVLKILYKCALEHTDNQLYTLEKWKGDQYYKDIKVGDFVETCSLMAGVVMSIDGDDIEVRMLDVDEYSGQSYACCSLKNCSRVKLTSKQALKRLSLGKEKLATLFQSAENYEHYVELINQQP